MACSVSVRSRHCANRLRAACREINRLRREENAFVFAVDLPTGLDGDSGKADPDCVVADFLTVTIGRAKHGLVGGSARLTFVRSGADCLIELVIFQWKRGTAIASGRELLPFAPAAPHPSSAYKNQFGRIGVVAGSKGFTWRCLDVIRRRSPRWRRSGGTFCSERDLPDSGCSRAGGSDGQTDSVL